MSQESKKIYGPTILCVNRAILETENILNIPYTSFKIMFVMKILR